MFSLSTPCSLTFKQSLLLRNPPATTTTATTTPHADQHDCCYQSRVEFLRRPGHLFRFSFVEARATSLLALFHPSAILLILTYQSLRRETGLPGIRTLPGARKRSLHLLNPQRHLIQPIAFTRNDVPFRYRLSRFQRR